MTTSSPLVSSLGFVIFQITAATVRLEVPNLLDTPKTADELAALTGAHPRALLRLLRAAAATGLLRMTGSGAFELTELGAMFRSDSPTAGDALVRLNSQAEVWKAWGTLEQTVRDGRSSAFRLAHGVEAYEALKDDPETAALFHTAMASGTRDQLRHLIDCYDFGDARHVVDIGGGNGTHLAAILRAHPGLRGSVFDTANGAVEAADQLRRAGLSDRCDVVAGDFFDSVPPGADLYLMKNILVDWDDDACVRILGNIRRAIAPDGRLVVVGTVMPEDPSGAGADEFLSACIFDICLMITVNGWERTRSEYESLFTKAGFALASMSRVGDGQNTALFHKLEARPV
ncbi:methyltransferase [Spirillospora sp. NPDC049652]